MDAAILWAGLAIGLAWFGVTLGEALVARTSIEVNAANPEMGPVFRKLTILGIALVESAAIYGLIMALLIIYAGEVTQWQAITAGLAVGLPGAAAGLGEAWIVVNTLKGLLRNPRAEKDLQSNMILYIALVESAAIYGLITSLLILYS